MKWSILPKILSKFTPKKFYEIDPWYSSKILARVEVTNSDKHCSLVRYIIHYALKNVYTRDPEVNVTKVFTHLMYGATQFMTAFVVRLKGGCLSRNTLAY